MRVCAREGCNKSLEGRRADAKWCSGRCRGKAHKTTAGYREYMRRYRDENKAAISAQRRARREAVLDEDRERCRRYYWEHRDRRLEQGREWRADNADRHRQACHSWREANREATREYSRLYGQTPAGKASSRAHKARRRAAGEPKAADIDALWAGKQSRTCPRCKKARMRKDRPSTFHVDHILPVARGGDSRPANLQLLCPTCNLAKRDHLEGW